MFWGSGSDSINFWILDQVKQEDQELGIIICFSGLFLHGPLPL